MLLQIIILFLLKITNMEAEIKNFPLYKISNEGEVKSLITNKILKPQIQGIEGKQYYSVSLRKEGETHQKAIHRLVAEAFIANPENKPTVNHLDFDTFNNFDWNLGWATYSEQEQHKIAAGRGNHAGGKSHYKAKKVYQYLKDRVTFVKEYECIMDVARAFDITNASTSSIIKVCNAKKNFNSAYGYFWSYTKLN